jgi:hypothetical protein
MIVYTRTTDSVVWTRGFNSLQHTRGLVRGRGATGTPYAADTFGSFGSDAASRSESVTEADLLVSRADAVRGEAAGLWVRCGRLLSERAKRTG